MKVLIVGAGNIGRRHMQGLAGVPEVTGVNLVDPSAKALKLAKQMALAEEKEGRRINVHLHRSIPDTTHDLAIIATNANQRRVMWERVRAHCKWVILEKFLFNDPREYNVQGLRDGSTFVNCSRRAMSCWDVFRSAPQVSIFYYGFEGLLCNAVHFLDLLQHLCGQDGMTISLSLGKRHRSKRKGYWDSEGSLTAITTDKRGCLYLNTKTLKRDAPPMLIVNDCVVDEAKMTLTDTAGAVQFFSFKMQSKLTGEYVQQLAARGTCSLPDYYTAARTHLLLLEQLRRMGWKRPVT